MKKVKVLWTGGFDSTFRVTQLSRMDVKIEPYYLSDGRLSEEYELNAIREITEYLEGLNETKAKFLHMVYHTLDELEKDCEIADALSKVLENDYSYKGQTLRILQFLHVYYRRGALRKIWHTGSDTLFIEENRGLFSAETLSQMEAECKTAQLFP